MINPAYSGQALDQLRREIENESRILLEKQNSLKRIAAEKISLDNIVKSKKMEVTHKEQELVRLKMEIQQATPRLTEAERMTAKLESEIDQHKREHTAKNQELMKVQREYQDALHSSAAKGGAHSL